MYISVAKDFSPHPGPRKRSQGPYSGEEFRAELVKHFKRIDRLIVDLDGTSGFGSSFLDEAFGGLVRDEGMTPAELSERLIIKSEMDASYLDEVDEAIRLAKPH